MLLSWLLWTTSLLQWVRESSWMDNNQSIYQSVFSTLHRKILPRFGFQGSSTICLRATTSFYILFQRRRVLLKLCSGLVRYCAECSSWPWNSIVFTALWDHTWQPQSTRWKEPKFLAFASLALKIWFFLMCVFVFLCPLCTQILDNHNVVLHLSLFISVHLQHKNEW